MAISLEDPYLPYILEDEPGWSVCAVEDVGENEEAGLSGEGGVSRGDRHCEVYKALFILVA